MMYGMNRMADSTLSRYQNSSARTGNMIINQNNSMMTNKMINRPSNMMNLSMPTGGGPYQNQVFDKHSLSAGPVRNDSKMFYSTNGLDNSANRRGYTSFKEVWRKAIEKYSPKKSTKLNEVSERFQMKL